MGHESGEGESSIDVKNKKSNMQIKESYDKGQLRQERVECIE